MYIPVSWLSAEHHEETMVDDHGEEKRIRSSGPLKMFRLQQSILSEREQTFFLDQQQATELFERRAGEVILFLRDSVQLGSSAYPCGGQTQIDRPGDGVRQHLIVEVEERFTMSYGCSMHTTPYDPRLSR